jgi:hypothetical protein
MLGGEMDVLDAVRPVDDVPDDTVFDGNGRHPPLVSTK